MEQASAVFALADAGRVTGVLGATSVTPAAYLAVVRGAAP